MNWFKGSIAEAVTISKQKNATFVVYVEGKDENSVKLSGFLDKPIIREKLETDDFVAIKIEGGSEAYMQFARIYQIVPLPSLFFIGKNGTPLEIATGIIGSSDELDKKIENVLKITGKIGSSPAASASAAFISGEQRSQADDPVPSTSVEAKKDVSPPVEPASLEDTTPSISSLSSVDPPTSIADTPASVSVEKETPSGSPADVFPQTICSQKPNYTRNSEETPDPPSDNASTNADSISMDTVSTPPPNVPTPPATPPETVKQIETPKPAVPSTAPTSANKPVPTPTVVTAPPPTVSEENATAAKIDEAKPFLEERRKLKQAEEDRQERDRELKRRKESKNTQNVQQWQKEQDFKDLKESIRRDRMEDQAARQRILSQIASDRAERAHKYTPPAVPPTPPTPAAQPTTPTTVNTPNLDMSRIQFRIPNGETNTQTFESSDTFATVRAYVKVEVIKGTGIKDFTLATTFPKHEFTTEDDTLTLLSLGLCPSAVILVIAKASTGPAAVVARSGGIINIFNTVFWALLSPVMAVFGYLRNFITGNNNGEAEDRPTNSGAQKRANEERIDPNDLAKKRNLDRFLLTKDGPSTSKEAIATATSTGGAYRRVGGSNIHRLSDQRKDSDDENNTWNGNSTQQQ